MLLVPRASVMKYLIICDHTLTLSGPGLEKLAQTKGADSAPPLNAAPLYPN